MGKTLISTVLIALPSLSFFQLVNIGLTAARDQFSATYIINPQEETCFFVFGNSY